MDETKPEIIIKMSGDVNEWKTLLAAVDTQTLVTGSSKTKAILTQFANRVRIALNLGV